MKFYKCGKCQSVAIEVIEGDNSCEKTFQELKANSVDASGEKHVPVVEVKGESVTVTVGSLEHPMLEEHYIMWICLETKKGGIWKLLKPGEKPEAEFLLQPGDEPVAAYEYCNLHGLWKAEIK